MKRMLLKKKRSIFIMLLVIFLVILVPLYVLGFGIYRWGYSISMEEITNSLYASADFYMGTLESEISRISSLQYECLNDENLFYFVNASEIMTEFQKANDLLALQKRLSVMKNSSNYIKEVNVYLPRIGKMIEAKGGVRNLTDEWKNILFAKADSSSSRIIYAADSMYMCASYPVVLASPEATPLYILIVELSEEDIQSRLLSFNHYPEGGAVLTNYEQHLMLSGGSNNEAAEKIGREGIFAGASDSRKALTVKFNDDNYILTGRYSEYLNMELSTFVPEVYIFSKLKHYQILFLGFSLAALVVIVIFSLSAYRLIQKPMKRLVNSLTKMQQGNLSVRIKHPVNDEYSYLYSSFNNMAESLQTLIDQNYKQQLLTQRAELRQLQAQINPHFLYNSFFILYRMAKEEDYDNITRFLQYLSDYYRFITRSMQMEVLLENEVKHAQNYTEIQLVRFCKRITASFAQLPDSYRTMPVPRIILQPVIENAFEHGLKDVQADGKLEVSFEELIDGIIIKVEDNGEGMTDEKLNSLSRSLEADDDNCESTGIVNIHRRLRLKLGPDGGLSLSRSRLGGLRVDIKLCKKE